MRFVVFSVACCSALAFGLISPIHALAQNPAASALAVTPSAPSPAVIRPEVLPREAAELEIALGRIRLVPDRFRILRKHEQFDWPSTHDPSSAGSHASSSHAASSHAAGEHAASPQSAPAKTGSRSLQVIAQDGRPAVKLSYSDPQEKWTLAVDPIVGAEWTRELLASQPPVVIQYQQPPHQPITVQISGLNAKPIKFSAATLWHLTEQNRPEFTSYVLPALLRLNSTWSLPNALAAAKRMRTHSELPGHGDFQHELAQYISQLDSSDRAQREAAKQALRECGLAAHIPLEQLRAGPLTTQQRSTVDELLLELEPRTADTPTRLAYWLSGDPTWR